MKIEVSTKTGLLPFLVCKSKTSRILWINNKLLNSVNMVHLTNPEEFKNRFSYFVKNNQFFEEMILDESDCQYALAERYGGSGIGPNGGGARCGNVSDFQLKGLGRNQLSGDECDHWHSYGGVNLVDAIYESIYSLILNKLMPLGAMNVYGVLISGRRTAMLPGMQDKAFDERRGYGALMVRDIAMRPAHFLPCPDFMIKGKNIAADSIRLAETSRKFFDNFASNVHFINFFSNCVSNYAKQFAFSRIARIAHGGLSSSNISLDGRWLDLSNTSFIGGGKNITNNLPFLAEQDFVIPMIKEFIHNFSKHNNINLNYEPFVQLYKRVREAYKLKYVSYYFGVQSENIIKIGVENYQTLFEKILKGIDGRKKIETGRVKELSESDPILILISSIFIGSYAKYETLYNHEDINNDNLMDSSVRLFDAIYSELDRKDIPKSKMVKAMYVIALKRILGSEFFFMGRLENYIYETVVSNNIERIENLINDAEILIESLFDLNKDIFYHCRSDANVVIIEINNAKIAYNFFRDEYIIDSNGSQVVVKKVADLMGSLISLIGEVDHSGFDIKKYLDKFITAVCYLEGLDESR